LSEKVTLDEFKLAWKDWTFAGASTRELTHCYHDYPARMIPQVAAKLLDLYGFKAKTLFDPYCGTGTSLVEGFIRGIDVTGTDLNPLARLIARTKVSTPQLQSLDLYISKFRKFISQPIKVEIPLIKGISRLDFWFKPQVMADLAQIKCFIAEINDEAVKIFFQVAFSETVRECSNTRNEEFKLYRIEAEKLESYNPATFEIFCAKLNRNRTGLINFLAELKSSPLPATKIYDFDTSKNIPKELILDNSVDIIITSPPYGDSQTTVAYGQYSRLSSAWLDLAEPEKVDRRLMGGKILKSLPDFSNPILNQALSDISQIETKRALEVASFYVDLHASIENIAKLTKTRGYACYVVGNRKVKGTILPTDLAIQSFFEKVGFEHIATYTRAIPNKRMPLRNSPSNVTGITDSTMHREYIVVMRKT
jgi:DNA modification methylase